MHKIVNKQVIANDIKRIEVSAEAIARKIKPGQFVMVMPDEKSGKIPLAVADTDSRRNLITLVFQENGAATKKLGALQIGNSLFSLLGPLGMPVEIEKIGTVACLGYGVGIAQILPICRALKEAGNKVIGLIGAKTKRSLILESQMRIASYKLYVMTEDGSYGQKGLIEDVLPKVLKEENIKLAYAVGSAVMLKAVCGFTRQASVKTLVGLNPIMVDGTGLCGSCRVIVDGKKRLACVDGPVFDGHQVDFEDLMVRMK
ncbi:MAG TPA: sulfide/dihydroorotate dehydrogenase-like FAD/NAD-binding protein [Candidatus Omnitrophota bacterium]|nr:sulfide/dihydroorotate dehydrogenase-like FAD/NAD-binding protein [Candidatus Omnitrophota bacterium]HPD83857.1 sulfide/dihydroorotate dehydrogenase-like FAD/NAD-binding protein [Candidatus Omnitrophota bacterium]HRZ02714.1 sulfide/dihydroorotate dehydrogenase-like FAD/NAD-binding protein [Candidatus Omnitrophota bacterium]